MLVISKIEIHCVILFFKLKPALIFESMFDCCYVNPICWENINRVVISSGTNLNVFPSFHFIHPCIKENLL